MTVTADQAIANAARLLDRAEIELTNLPLMERLDELAASWLQLAAMLLERERV
ncbi:hypothetical protein [Streptomyces sp. CBMA152]|uniref:hypothetical protein n=1 Tax=Streptomyces sp. CBMA152 TaxID=1896312 RepID=UPI0016600BA5|nr:hypothetical protein [Streptomyces sp. CBMA152]